MELLQHNLDFLAIGCALGDEVKTLLTKLSELPLNMIWETHLSVLHFCWRLIFEEVGHFLRLAENTEIADLVDWRSRSEMGGQLSCSLYGSEHRVWGGGVEDILCVMTKYLWFFRYVIKNYQSRSAGSARSAFLARTLGFPCQ